MRQSVVAAVLPLVLAAVTLTGVGRGSDQDVPALIKLLQDKHRQVRGSAARALGRMAPAAKEAVPAYV